MTQIVPTITAFTPEEYASQMKILSEFAERIHIDVTDGDFAPSQTVNLNQIYWDKGEMLNQIDLHLMVQRPIEWLDQLVSLSPDLVILHVESDDAYQDLPRIFEHLHKFDIKVGVALLPDTDVSSARQIIELSDHVLIFGGHLGYQGGTADLKQLDKVASICNINSNVEIAWDGGASLENIQQVIRAGINIVNVGSAIIKSNDPEESYIKLVKSAKA